MFGGMVALLAGCVFAAILSLPRPSPAYAQQPLALVSTQTIQPIELARLSEATRTYTDTLKRVAPANHNALMSAFSAPRQAGQSAHSLALAEGLSFVRSEKLKISQIPIAKIDAFLDDTRTQLWIASRKKHSLCAGHHYMDVLNVDTLTPDVINSRITWLNAQIPDFSMQVLTALLEGAELSLNLPEVRGDMNTLDHAALTGVTLSIASDEQLMPVLNAPRIEGARAEAIENVDACQLAATAVSAIKTLPQDTKGRTFTRVVQYYNEHDQDLGAFLYETFF